MIENGGYYENILSTCFKFGYSILIKRVLDILFRKFIKRPWVFDIKLIKYIKLFI